MGHYALIGRRLGHSWSQRWFEGLFGRLGLQDYTYELHETERLDDLRQWVEAEHIAGFNVTVPYKRAIIPLLDALDPEATAIGAVNCVVAEDGRLTGYNTDAPAFRQTLGGLRFGQALVLGTGGAARAVAHALRQEKTPVVFASRHPQGAGQVAYADLRSLPLAEPTLVVNATPVGMHPDADRSPLDPATLRLPPGSMVYDLVYNPSPTLLMRRAAALGLPVRDGLAMLERQAELSWELWQGR